MATCESNLVVSVEFRTMSYTNGDDDDDNNDGNDDDDDESLKSVSQPREKLCIRTCLIFSYLALFSWRAALLTCNYFLPMLMQRLMVSIIKTHDSIYV